MSSALSFSGVRAIALVEAAKGGIVLLAGFGLLSLMHHDVERLAEHLVGWLHLDPSRRFSHVFLEAAARVNDKRLLALAGLAILYAILRLTEAYGLWNQRRWAEWFALLSGGIYLPFEIYELTRGIHWMKLTAFIINIGIVIYMAYMLYHPSARSKHAVA